MVKFSVTIPAFKKEYLAEAIDSVLSQTYENFELIIVDDCSPEDLKAVVDNYQDSRIIYFRNEKNCGAVDVVDNWNICLDYCSGDFVICMGDDDRLLPWCLYEYSLLISKYPSLNVFHAWTQIIDEYGNVKDTLEPRPEIESFFSLTYFRWFGRKQYIGDFCFRVSHLKSNNGYYKLPLAWGSDDISAARAALFGGVANTLKPCFEYRQSNLTISSGTLYTRIKLESSLDERKWYKDLLLNVNASILTPSDKWFYDKIMLNIEHCSMKKMADEIALDVFSNPLRLFAWLRNCTAFGLSRLFLFKRLLINLVLKK